MNYEIISRERVQEPQRGQNYSEFYYTTYIVVKYETIEEEKTFTFYEESEDEIDLEIKTYFNNNGIKSRVHNS